MSQACTSSHTAFSTAQLGKFTTVKMEDIRLLTSKQQDDLPPASKACILISTYTMMGFTGCVHGAWRPALGMRGVPYVIGPCSHVIGPCSQPTESPIRGSDEANL